MILKYKKARFTAIVALSLFLNSCSHKIPHVDKAIPAPLPSMTADGHLPSDMLAPHEFDEDIRSEKKTLTLTPQNASSEIFAEQSHDFGLHDVQGTHLYAVDFDNDGWTDLVVLPDYYSHPNFYKFHSNLKKFVKVENNLLPETVRSSFLVFYDFNRDKNLDMMSVTLNQKSSLKPIPPRIFLWNKNLKEYEESYFLFQGVQNNSLIADAFSSANISDFNGDGIIDIFFPSWYSKDGNNLSRPDFLLFGNSTFMVPRLSNPLETSKGKYRIDFEFDIQNALLTDEWNISENTFVPTDSPQRNQYLKSVPSFGASLCDVDHNGMVDILVSASNGHGNQLWRNEFLTDGDFKNYGKITGLAFDNPEDDQMKNGGNHFFSLCLDYNNDTFPDIFLGALNRESDHDGRDYSSFLTAPNNNFPYKYLRTEIFFDHLPNQKVMSFRRGTILDFNNDGLVDLLVDNSGFPPYTRLNFLMQADDHGFDEVSKNFGIDILNPSGTVSIDLNQDGFMDFISAQSNLRLGKFNDGNRKVFVFVNQSFKNLQWKNHKSLRIKFQTQDIIPGAWGGSIQVETNKRKLWRMIEYVSGSLPSQNEDGIHFGLGTDDVKKITVKYPFLKNGRPYSKEYTLSAKQKKILNTKKYLEIILSE